ncbi:hypothetical protein CVT25_007847 [Psilocybe cyanescens]|uniref:Peptidase A1 domain-containing protein n=1 Tax=Psilocybe cyanescens TaxID=93625 RepID=A0A409XJI1_PSICY|nr:hypothetical protein CVT25_007847 [Psilocybe cyanescens]
MATTFTSAKWKDKARALDPDVSSFYFEPLQRKTQRGRKRQSQQETKTERQRRDGDGVTVEGDGAADGVVLPLDMVGSGVYDREEGRGEEERKKGGREMIGGAGDGAPHSIPLLPFDVDVGVHTSFLSSFVHRAAPPCNGGDDEEQRSGLGAQLAAARGVIILFLSSSMAYTLPVKFGSKNQQFSLQIDTGSSDLWVASTSCSTSSCKLAGGRLYDPSGSRATGVDFSIPYLQGSAAGPVVWDRVSIGGYEIDNQAFARSHASAPSPAAAANDVQSEPLTPKFSGILGLGLPPNSIITASIPPLTSNAPDGAAWASNLFSITPASLAPAARFLSLALARPGSDRVPSLLGIGRHPAALVPDPSKIAYSTLGEASRTLFWKVGVRAITVYVGGERKAVNVGKSASGAALPSAVVDSGVPLILTTSAIASAVYGAIGVEPAADGQYYVPCTTPLNLTLTLDTRPEIPIHPLDLTAEPPDDNQAAFCTGLIQTTDAQLASANGGIGDMILGIPFLRNVYSVMAYMQPAKDGSFAPVASRDDGDNRDAGGGDIKPRLGLLALTDPSVALQEFNTVRVLHQPLSSSLSSSASSLGGSTNMPDTGRDYNTKTVSTSSPKLSAGQIVAIAGLGPLVVYLFCCAVKGAFGWAVRRRDSASFPRGRGKSKTRREREREPEALGMGGAHARASASGSGTGGAGLSTDQKAAYAAVRNGGLGVSFVAVPVMGMGRVGEEGVLLSERKSKRTLLGSSKGVGESDEQGEKGENQEVEEAESGVRRGMAQWDGKDAEFGVRRAQWDGKDTEFDVRKGKAQWDGKDAEDANTLVGRGGR